MPSSKENNVGAKENKNNTCYYIDVQANIINLKYCSMHEQDNEFCAQLIFI